MFFIDVFSPAYWAGSTDEKYELNNLMQVLALHDPQFAHIFRVTGPLCGEFTGHRWIPLTKASDAELWFFSMICARINGWVNIRKSGDLRRHRTHYGVTVMNNLCIIWHILAEYLLTKNNDWSSNSPPPPPPHPQPPPLHSLRDCYYCGANHRPH